MRIDFRGTASGIVVAIVLAVCSQASAQSNASRKALEAAASKGSAAATYALGAMAEADGDFEQALTLYSAAAEKGYAGAEFKLGELNRLGQGVAVDSAKAIEWYRKAAAHGSPQAEALLSQLQPSTASTTQPSSSDNNDSRQPSSTQSPEPQQAQDRSASPVPVPQSSQLPQATSAAPVAPLQTTAGSTTGDGNRLSIVAAIIAFFVGVFAWIVSRRLVMRWYQSRQFVIGGRSGMEMMAREAKLRLEMEWIPFLIGFGSGYVTYLVGSTVLNVL